MYKHGPLSLLDLTHTPHNSHVLLYSFLRTFSIPDRLGFFLQTSKAYSQWPGQFGAISPKGTIDTGKGRLKELLADLTR